MTDQSPAKPAPKRRRQVERIEDWENARYSMVPPRASRDSRLSVIHLRLLMEVGRVNTQHGWCEMSQSDFAARWDYNRGSVVRAVKELVAWRYLEKRGQQETHGARCHYRVLIDAPEEDEAAAELLDGEPDEVATLRKVRTVQNEVTCHVAGDTPPDGTCHVAGDTGVTYDVTHVSPIRVTYLDQRSKILPPNPREAGEQKDDLDGQKAGAPAAPAKPAPAFADRQATLLATLAAEVDHQALAVLFRPLLTERRWSSAAPLDDLIAAARLAKGLPRPALEAAWRLVRDSGVATVKPERLREAIEAARKGGAMLVIRPGSAQWARWLAHFEATDQPQARVMRSQPSWMVRAEWPPSGNGTSAEVSP